MQLYEYLYDAAMAANEAYIAERDNLPAYMQDILDPRTGDNFFTAGSWPDMICPFVEIVYVNKGGSAFAPLLSIAGSVAAHIAVAGFWDSLGGRASGISKALWRDGGEVADPNVPWPAAEDDPAINMTYAPPTS